MRLCVGIGMEAPEPVEEWKDLRHLIRPCGNMHLTVVLNYPIEVPLSLTSKHASASGGRAINAGETCVFKVVVLVR